MAHRQDIHNLSIPVHIDDRPNVSDTQLVRVNRAESNQIAGRISGHPLELPQDSLSDGLVQLAEFPGCKLGEFDSERQVLIPLSKGAPAGPSSLHESGGVPGKSLQSS